MTNPELSIVVCTYNREALLCQCLESLCAQTYPEKYFEVIIVDNNSVDGTYAKVSSFMGNHGNFRYVTEPNQGLSYCRNRGVNEAKGEYIAFIDDDARAVPDWAEKIISSFKDVKPVPSAVGGMILPFYDCELPRWFKDEYETRSWGNGSKFLTYPHAQYGFSGSNCALKKDILNEFGGFNTELGMKGKKLKLGEEADLFFRVYQKYPLFWYDPSIKVYHYTPSWKMKKSYHIKRQYIAGKSAAYIHRADISFEFLFRKVSELIYYTVKSFYSVIIDSRDDVFFRKSRSLVYKTGYLLESFKLLLKKFFIGS